MLIRLIRDIWRSWSSANPPAAGESGVQSAEFDALHLAAVRAYESGRLEEAGQLIVNALKINPRSAEAHSIRGIVLASQKRHEEALASFDTALAIRPDYAGALSNRGLALAELRRYDEALANYDKALSIRPDFAEASNNRGNSLYALGRNDEALVSYAEAIAHAPDYAEAQNNRGQALEALGRHQEALASYQKALAIRPDYAEVLNNHGNALHAIGRYDEALASYDKALSIRPDYAEALSNRGISLYVLGRYDEALADYDKALTIKPDYAEAQFNQSLCRLLMGDFERGWEQHEWRWKWDDFPSPKRDFPQPLWLGEEDIAGKTVLVHFEQGLGDTIQFARYVALVAAKGASVFFEVPKVLAPLMIGLAGPSRVFAEGEALPATDFHVPLLSLPLAFKTTLQSIPASIPYLSVPSGAASAWRKKLANDGETLVGLCWRGNPDYKGDRERSIPLADLIPLLSSPGIRFISLQKELDEKERVLTEGMANFTQPGEDFKNTAQIVAALDLVITVDTAWAHWAGAIGKPVWVLLPFPPHWCWLLEREDSPWYPTARLFRQPRIGDWDSVIGRVKHCLRQC